eukprot:m.99026 g.99026  ORF g.99026 m.99026 type:complete len:316 (+) comp10292_c0_seq1:42-989(+)
MVVFTCNACGDAVKKAKVEQHYLTVCRSCEVLSCIDCGKDFHGDDYKMHDSCISEAEKYQGATYKPSEKANRGDQKQQAWLAKVAESEAKITDPKLKAAFNKLRAFSNIPRKGPKFVKFAKNSLNIRDEEFVWKLWELFGGKDKSSGKPTPDGGQTSVSSEAKDASATTPTSAPQPTATQSTPSLIAQLEARKRKADASVEEGNGTDHATLSKKSKKAKKEAGSEKKKKEKKGDKKKSSKKEKQMGASGGDGSGTDVQKPKKSSAKAVDSFKTEAQAWLAKKMKKLEKADKPVPSQKEQETMLKKRIKKLKSQHD